MRSCGTSFRIPLGFRIEAGNSLSGVWILHVAQAVPHEPTDVEFVVQDARPALGVSVDRAGAPRTAEWTGDAFAIQVLGDLLGRDSSDEVAEDPLDDQWRDGRVISGNQGREMRHQIAPTITVSWQGTLDWESRWITRRKFACICERMRSQLFASLTAAITAPKL
jgi:hypothetical protein